MPPGITVNARDVRLPRRAREVVATRGVVEVLYHDKPSFVLLSAEDYAAVEPIIERRRRGLPVPAESLLTQEDFAVIADERAQDTGLDIGILASWEQ